MTPRFPPVTLPAMFRLLRAGESEGAGPVGFAHLLIAVRRHRKPTGSGARGMAWWEGPRAEGVVWFPGSGGRGLLPSTSMVACNAALVPRDTPLSGLHSARHTHDTDTHAA